MSYTHGSCLPLIGGSSIAATQVLGQKPRWIASWERIFNTNDQYFRQYFDDVPYYNIEENQYPLEKVDIVTALPPCAGLSNANTTTDKDRNASNPRGCNAPSNVHMLHASQFAMSNIHPKVIIVENAPMLFSRSGEPFAEVINDLAIKYGYSMSMVKTSTIKHGLPQIRPRTFFFLWKGNKVPILNSISKPYKPFYEILQQNLKKTDLVRNLSTGKPSDDYLWKFIRHKNPSLTKQEILIKYAGKRMNSVFNIIYSEGWLPECVSWVANKNERTYRWISRVYKKLSSGGGILDSSVKLAWDQTHSLMWKTLPVLMHPFEDRWLMISEVLALMGFPSDFAEKVYIPTRHSNVACQNVPVNTAADWIREAIKAIDGEREWVSPPINEETNKPRILRQSNIHGKVIMKPKWKP